MKWNGTDWINYYCMEVTYTDTEAHIDYSLWNKNKKAFVPTQKYVYTLDEAGKFWRGTHIKGYDRLGVGRIDK